MSSFSSSQPDDRVLTEFLLDLAEDRISGDEHPVEHYLARFPGHEARVRAEFEAALHPHNATESTLGPYRLLRELGRGGQGIVFLAQPLSGGEEVALKVLSGSFGRLPEERRQRFRREAVLLARLDHPGLGRVLAADPEHDPPWIAMERLHGEPLAARIARWRGEGLDDHSEADRQRLVLCLIAGAARALGVAHAASLIHRDLKPGNIFLNQADDPVLIDFGLAREAGAAAATLTGTEDLLGTPAYLAPDLIEGRSRASNVASDLYALGVTLYESLTLQVPFQAGSRDALYRQILRGDIPPPERFLPSLLPQLGVVVRKALESSPKHRYADAEAFASDLEAVAAGRVPTATRPSPWRRSGRWARRNPVATTAFAGVLCVLLVAHFITASLLGVAQEERDAKVDALSRLEASLRLSDAEAIRSLEQRRRRLPFADGPDQPPGQAMATVAAWLEEAAALIARGDEHRKEIELLRRRSLPYDRSQRDADIDAQRTKRESLVIEYEGLLAAEEMAPDSESAPNRRERIAELQTILRETWTFEASADAWRHDALTGLVNRLGEFAAKTQAVRTRFELSGEQLRLAQQDHAPLWLALRRRLSGAARYAHPATQDFDAIPGLVPLGPDPESGLEEFAHHHSGRIPVRASEASPIEAREGDAIVLVLIPGTNAQVGADPGRDPLARDDEQPIDKVELAPYLIGKFEVTQGQWLRLSGRNPSRHTVGDSIPGAAAPPVTESHPVEWVPWHEAMRELGRFGLTLPTEVQWEHAARGGRDHPWPSGASTQGLERIANLKDGVDEITPRDGFAAHTPVGQFAGNGFGLHDTTGNLIEWCRDAYASYEHPARSGDGLRLERGVKRVLRGGSFLSSARNARVSRREKAGLFWGLNIGLRAARAWR